MLRLPWKTELVSVFSYLILFVLLLLCFWLCVIRRVFVRLCAVSARVGGVWCGVCGVCCVCCAGVL
jgi:hypothetical protein